MNKRLYLDFHVIQTVPPSCLNRDDTGSPKTAIYGGVQRARVSSQSWKRAVREMFKENLDEASLGVRTKKIVDLVAEKILASSECTSDEAFTRAETIINAAGVTTKDQEAKALFFMSNQQAENLAALALLEEKPDKKTVQAALNKGLGIDIALFGRMVADDPSLNADASAQVAHAISTHRVDIEYDYFTAVDDRAPEDNAGAGMIGTIEFDSATLYRYATIAIHELYEQLARDVDATSRTVSEFARAFVTSMPTGKQNTFANRTPADAVLVSLRTDQPINLVGAFEEAVRLRSNESGYVKPSVVKLAEHHQKIVATFAEAPLQSWNIGVDIESSENPGGLNGLLRALEHAVSTSFESLAADED
jgi:CRISPR system Cascade subunit CasC